VGFGFKRQPDRFENLVEFTIDFKVGEPENSVPEAGQDFVSDLVTPAVFVEPMLIAVDLNNEARLAAFEIDDVICQRRLPAEVVANCAKLSKPDPQLHFLACHRFS
jgi:hypothetical protein